MFRAILKSEQACHLRYAENSGVQHCRSVMVLFGGFGNVLESYWNRCNPNGWGICVFNLGALQPDNGAGLTSYLIGLVNKGNWRKPGDWGNAGGLELGSEQTDRLF